ncbi:ABC transporter permease [Canibacter sp. lx-72]|uniref:ABC transporter permease n=1 Tax=Canibacter zhuwentaonis TaxID=2837491 RepID=UPI001BDC5D4B|nr:ABC transporter permease [Canibacter zhuwentaonis]
MFLSGFKRFGQALLVLLSAYTAAFLLLAALPSDGVLARYGNPELGLSLEQLQEIRAVYGIDEQLSVRYLKSLGSFLQGDLGYSVQSGAKVADLLAQALPATLLLAGLGLLGALVLALIIAVAASYNRGGIVSSFFRNLPPLFVSLPVFWVGIVFIQIFSFKLGLVPTIGATETQALVLPVLTLMIPIAAPLAQVFLRSIDDVNRLPFVRVVETRGATQSWVLWRNVIPNALLPVLTVAGVLFGELVGGAIVTETVFGRTGLGSLTAQAVANRDTPVLLAVVVIVAAVYVVINFLVDLIYPILDPRLRNSAANSRDAVQKPMPIAVPGEELA